MSHTPRKRFGQNFLHDPGVVKRIIAAIDPQPGEPIVEPPIDPPSLPNFLQETFHVVYIMISAMTKLNLEADPPEFLLQPDIPPEIDLLLGYDRAEEVIAAGEASALGVIQEIVDSTS